MRRAFFLAAMAAVHLCATALPVAAQNYPSRPIRVIVPFEASGAMDVVMRIVGKKISDSGAAQIVIENKTGAGGVIGVMAVKDFQPVTLLVRVPTLLVVPVSSPANSVADLIQLAKTKPGGLSYGSAGIGSAPHITAALLQKSAGAPMTHVPYRGLAGAMTDILGGRLEFVFSSIPSLGGTVADGKVKVLAAAGSKRIQLYPNIPSMAELGRPEVDVDLWFGIVAPLGTDPAIVRTLNAMFVKAANDPELTERFNQLGVEIATGTPEDFRKTLQADNARLGPFVKQLTAAKPN